MGAIFGLPPSLLPNRRRRRRQESLSLFNPAAFIFLPLRQGRGRLVPYGEICPGDSVNGGRASRTNARRARFPKPGKKSNKTSSSYTLTLREREIRWSDNKRHIVVVVRVREDDFFPSARTEGRVSKRFLFSPSFLPQKQNTEEDERGRRRSIVIDPVVSLPEKEIHQPSLRRKFGRISSNNSRTCLHNL